MAEPSTAAAKKAAAKRPASNAAAANAATNANAPAPSAGRSPIKGPTLPWTRDRYAAFVRAMKAGARTPEAIRTALSTDPAFEGVTSLLTTTKIRLVYNRLQKAFAVADKPLLPQMERGGAGALDVEFLAGIGGDALDLDADDADLDDDDDELDEEE
jgi:hypothetical protein